MGKINKRIEQRYLKDFQKGQELRQRREFEKAIKILHRVHNYYNAQHNDALAAESLFMLAECYYENEQIQESHEQLIKLSQSSEIKHNANLAAVVNQRLGIIEKELGNPDKAHQHFLKSYKYYKSLNDIPSIIAVLASLGYLFRNEMDFEKSVEYYEKAESLSNRYNITKDLSHIYYNLSEIHLKLRNTEQFNKYINLTLSSYDYIKDPDSQITFLINISALLSTLGEFEQKEQFLLDILEVSKEKNLKGCKTSIMLNLGFYYLEKERFEESEDITLEALKIASRDKSYWEICFAYHLMALLHRKKEKYVESITFAKKSLKISNELGYIHYRIKNYFTLGKTYRKMGEYLQSFRYFTQLLNEYRSIMDKLSTEELRESYKENFQDLPDILEELNQLIEEESLNPDVDDLFSISQTSAQACRTGNKLIADFNGNKCQEQQKSIVKKIASVMENQLIEIKELLVGHGFETPIRDFEEALEIYESGRRAQLPLIRNTLEGVVKEVLKDSGTKPKSMQWNIQKLEEMQVLKSTPENRQDPHIERSIVYKIYGLLSNYGSHPSEYDAEITETNFLDAIHWIYLILKRYSYNKST